MAPTSDSSKFSSMNFMISGLSETAWTISISVSSPRALARVTKLSLPLTDGKDTSRIDRLPRSTITKER